MLNDFLYEIYLKFELFKRWEMKINMKIWLSDFENFLIKNDMFMICDNIKILKMFFDYLIFIFVKI